MAEKREKPYIWVTWLTKLLVGDNSCEWAAWFKAHYQKYDQVPDTFDSARWQMKHTELLNRVRVDLEAEGKTVFIERQNRFTLKGAIATLGGRPDLIAISGDRGVIYDVKTGQPTPSDHIQVMTYMYSMPKAFRQYREMAFDGMVVYHDHRVPIPAAAVNDSFVSGLIDLIRKVGSPEPLRKVPSGMECGFCPIASSECPERMEGNGKGEGDNEVSDF